MPRTDAASVREELGVSQSEYSDDEAATDIRRAGYLVDARVADRLDDTELLTDLETLVAAHFAHEAFTDTTADGQQIKQLRQGSRSVSFDTSGTTGPGGFASPYWSEALAIDPTGRLGVHTRSAHVTSTSDSE
ncbi:hypothetical protein [Halomarina oriensis]|uniref:Uncharacterized protein n=1 Tax=Halomarina oriensis TaxID=671145 RepID=A0A6B0GIX0_9EURY|nr:hypothetical protein [Halomarina oriensis]MWG34826.1 hypothetical protein [Halomarina oriensis]